VKYLKRPRNLALAVFLILAVIVGGITWYAHRPKQLNLPQPPLKELAAKQGVAVGNFAILNHLNEWQYRQILTTQFDFVLADNTPNWYFTDGGLRPSPTAFNFRQMDQVVHFAQANKMPIQAHHFVWGEEKWLPDWLKNGNYSRQQLLDIIKNHILTVGGHYKGQIREWTVVNEAFTRQQHLYGLHDWWADHTGDETYIDQSFIWARQADPNAKLILNDFHNEIKNDVSDAMYNYVKDAKARGIPIDGIGMQMHIDGTHPPVKEDVISNMKRFGDLGVQVYVTEFDVNMHDVKANPTDRNKTEADIYYDMLRACIESKVCHSFAYLGITDKETWYNYLGFQDANPLPFDRDYKPKPAWFSMRTALEQPVN